MPPRYPLVRYHGVLAPHSKWRRRVVPRPRPESPERAIDEVKKTPRSHAPKATKGCATGNRKGAAPAPAVRRTDVSRAFEVGASLAAPSSAPSSSVASTPPQNLRPGTLLGEGFIAVRHWDRLLRGLLLARGPRVPWATLLRRTHAIDGLQCAPCGGRLRILGAVLDPKKVRTILGRLGVPEQPARAPPSVTERPRCMTSRRSPPARAPVPGVERGRLREVRPEAST